MDKAASMDNNAAANDPEPENRTPEPILLASASPRRRADVVVAIMPYPLPWERRLVATMAVLFFATIVLYVYLVLMSVVHVAAYRDLISKVATAKNEVSTLESSYFAKSSAITESYAESHGYVAVSTHTFVTAGSALSLQ